MPDPTNDITLALKAVRDNADDAQATGALIEMVYDQLRAIAQARMNNERVGHTLQATALVNEACVRLLGANQPAWQDRGHFYRAAAEAMRRILVDHARKKNSEKRGGGKQRAPINVLDLAAESDPADVLALDDALERLEAEDHNAAEVVRLRFFGGMSVEAAADVMGVSERTVAREWAFARARLHELLRHED